MKKALSIVLVVAFALSISAVAFADSAKKVLEPLVSNITTSENEQKTHVAETTISASKLEINTNEEVTLTATTIKHGQFSLDAWTSAIKFGETVLNGSGDSYLSYAKFKSPTPGTYTISYKIEMDAGKNDGKFVGEASITIKVVEPKPDIEKVKSFKIARAHIGNQDNGNTKQALYITKLLLTYESGKTSEVNVNVKIGNIYSKADRKFDVEYEGVSIQFSAEKVLSEMNLKAYPGPEIKSEKKDKEKNTSKPVKVEKVEKPGKTEMPIK